MRWFEYLKVAPEIPNVKQPIVDSNLQQLRTILQEMRDAQWVDNETFENFSGQQNEYAFQLSEQESIRTSWDRGGPDCCPSGSSAAKAAKSDEEDSGEGASAACLQSRPD